MFKIINTIGIALILIAFLMYMYTLFNLSVENGHKLFKRFAILVVLIVFVIILNLMRWGFLSGAL